MKNKKIILSLLFIIIIAIFFTIIFKVNNKNDSLEKNITTTTINTVSVVSEQIEEDSNTDSITTILPPSRYNNGIVEPTEIIEVEEKTEPPQKIVRDSDKVTITIEEESLTLESAIIIINDTNTTPYETWDSIYKLQKRINNE